MSTYDGAQVRIADYQWLLGRVMIYNVNSSNTRLEESHDPLATDAVFKLFERKESYQLRDYHCVNLETRENKYAMQLSIEDCIEFRVPNMGLFAADEQDLSPDDEDEEFGSIDD